MIRAAGVLLIQGDEYVLQYRDDKPTIYAPGTYSLWGGTLEGSELPQEGALRELREETGIILQSTNLIPLHNYITVGEGPSSFGQSVHVYLFATKITPEVQVELREGQGVVRLPRYTEMHEKLNEFTKEAIEIYEAAAR